MEGLYMKRGFTLSEVLITIGIVGVIAVLVLPMAISNYQKRVYLTRIKYAYTVLSNAYISAQHELGDPSSWDWGEDNSGENLKRVLQTYILPYMNVMEVVPFADKYIGVRIKNGTTFMFVFDGCTNPETCNPVTLSTLRAVCSTKGLIATVGDPRRNYSRSDFVIDIKRANNRVDFFNWGNSSRNSIKDHSRYGCSKNIEKSMRLNCGALIFHDGWEIKDDYPW